MIRTRSLLVLVGTERMLLEFGSANFLEKARPQPDKVRQVLDKLRTDDIGSTVPMPFGEIVDVPWATFDAVDAIHVQP